jgi:hypothetical protein
MQAQPLSIPDEHRKLARPQIHWLHAAACITVILAIVGTALIAAAGLSKPGSMESLAFANGEAAHITFTNPGTDTLFQCVRGVVKNKQGLTLGPGGVASTKSMPVCTGDVKPHSTVELAAPFPVGAVRDLCSSPSDPLGPKDSLGSKQVDWALCSFEIEPMGGQGGGTP